MNAEINPISVPETVVTAPVDQQRIEAAVREILISIGEDPERDGLLQTPARVAKAYSELVAGMRQNPADVLSTTFDLGHEELPQQFCIGI